LTQNSHFWACHVSPSELPVGVAHLRHWHFKYQAFDSVRASLAFSVMKHQQGVASAGRVAPKQTILRHSGDVTGNPELATWQHLDSRAASNLS